MVANKIYVETKHSQGRHPAEAAVRKLLVPDRGQQLAHRLKAERLRWGRGRHPGTSLLKLNKNVKNLLNGVFPVTNMKLGHKKWNSLYKLLFSRQWCLAFSCLLKATLYCCYVFPTSYVLISEILFSSYGFVTITYWQAVKNSFVIFYSGERAKSKILKICDAFGANRYPFPEDLATQLHTIQEVGVYPCVLFFKPRWCSFCFVD